MSPTFIDGDYFVCCRWPYACLQAEDHILVKHPQYGHILKTIKCKTGEGLLLKGQNPKSLSTEKMGQINRQQIVGKIIWHVKQPSR